MKVVKDPKEICEIINNQRIKGNKVGLVPTMGALHLGHLSLLERSRKENDFTVTSIFINPIQFNSKTDLDLYPRTLENDSKLLEKAGSDVLFLPSPEVMYEKAPLIQVS